MYVWACGTIHAHVRGRMDMSERMKRLHIVIPESLDDDMRDYIAITYHRWEKGPISNLVIEALRMFLDPGTHTQKVNSKKYTNHKYDVLMAQIEAYIMPKYRYSEFNNIHEKHINEAIAAIKDIRDKRSIDGWRKKLEFGGYIETVEFGSKIFKILKVGNDGISIENTERE